MVAIFLDVSLEAIKERRTWHLFGHSSTDVRIGSWLPFLPSWRMTRDRCMHHLFLLCKPCIFPDAGTPALTRERPDDPAWKRPPISITFSPTFPHHLDCYYICIHIFFHSLRSLQASSIVVLIILTPKYRWSIPWLAAGSMHDTYTYF